MKPVAVVWSGPARADLLSIVDYIADRQPLNAERVLERLERRAAGLDRNPGRGRVVPELHAEGITIIREVIERPWRIVYEWDGVQVTVIGVFDGRRDLASLLLERILGR